MVVQLQLLTATVKLFLKQPASTQDMVQRVLNLATEESDNPDLRDRGYVYWRLLSTNPDAAKVSADISPPSPTWPPVTHAWPMAYFVCAAANTPRARQSGRTTMHHTKKWMPLGARTRAASVH